MTPAQALSDLDSALSTDGEDVRVRRSDQAGADAITCRAFVRGYQPKELIGGITQQDSKVIMSPTQIAAAGWQSGRPAHEDRRVPRKDDKVIIAGRPCNIEAAKGILLAGTLVRIELQARG